MPVLPLVASRIVRLWFSLPERSPSRTMLSAARSFTEPPGLKYSALAKISMPGNSQRNLFEAQQRRIADGREQRLGLRCAPDGGREERGP